MNPRKALVMGWFSFELYGATAGDIMAADVACSWLESAGLPYDVAYAPPFEGGVDWRAVEPSEYSDLIFVCGPFRESEVTGEFLGRFAHCRKTGLNLSMLQPLSEFNPFDHLLDRDSDRGTNPDMALLCDQPRTPTVGLLLVHPQKEYGQRGRHKLANRLVHDLIDRHPMAVVNIDTRLDENSQGLRSAREVESLIAKMDIVLTTRLHGTVLAIKNGVPAVAIDAISGGAKVSLQAQSIGWRHCYPIDTVTPDDLDAAFEFCCTPDGRDLASRCAANARQHLAACADHFVSILGRSPASTLTPDR